MKCRSMNKGIGFYGKSFTFVRLPIPQAANIQQLAAGRAVASSSLTDSYEQAEKALAVSLKRKTPIFEEDLKLDMCLTEISPGAETNFRKEY